MSDYIGKNLGPDEKVIMVAKHSYLCFIPMILSIAIQIIILARIKPILAALNNFISLPSDTVQILAIVVCVLAIIRNIVKILSIANTQLAITNKRVLGKVGIVSIEALDYPIDKVDHVSLSASFWGNVFKYYDLHVQSVGESAEIKFSGIKNAIEFKNHITLAIEQHSEEARRLQAEEIAKAMSKKP